MFKNRFNLRNAVAVAICLTSSATMFAQEETGIKINGIIWATRNVGAPNTFVANPEDLGMYYQWNNKVGWIEENVPSDGTSTWNGFWNGNGAEIWDTDNNVCPIGWRMPTKEEFERLGVGVWTTSPVNGRIFGNGDNTIFLPATGWFDNGEVTNASKDGQYWSSEKYDKTYAGILYFNNNVSYWNGVRPFYGLCIRCMKDDTATQTWDIGYPNETDIKATLKGNTLTINGIGAMKDFPSDGAPWKSNSFIQNVVIQEGVSNVGNYAFAHINELKTITFPETITSIGERAFNGCQSLISVILPNSVASIGDFAFYDCNELTSVILGNSDSSENHLTTIGMDAFAMCRSLISITIPYSVISIGEYAFYYCDLMTSATIGSSVTNIGNHSFGWCISLKDFYTEMETPVNIEDKQVFEGLDLSKITLYTTYGTLSAYEDALVWQDFGTKKEFLYGGDGDMRWRFEDDNLIISGTGAIPNYYEIGDTGTKTNAPWDIVRTLIKNIVIEEGITQIRDYNFFNCINATKVEIGKNVTSISNYAFAKCAALDSVIIKGNIFINVLSNSFREVNTSQVILKVSSATVDMYKSDDVWKTFDIIENVNSIANIKALDLKIYPNPVENYLYILSEHSIGKVEIYNKMGALVMLESNFIEKINISTLQQDLYVAKIYINDTVVVRKLIKKN